MVTVMIASPRPLVMLCLNRSVACIRIIGKLPRYLMGFHCDDFAGLTVHEYEDVGRGELRETIALDLCSSPSLQSFEL